MGLTVIYRANDELTANSIRDLLLQNGIPTMIKLNQLSVYGGSLGDPGSFGIWGEVLIDDANIDKAEELIFGFLGTLGYLAEADVDEDDLEAQALAAEPEEQP